MCIVKNFIWTTLQENPQIPDVQIVVSQPNIARSEQTIHQWKAYLFKFHVMNTQTKRVEVCFKCFFFC